jgi:allophanate hydrolase
MKPLPIAETLDRLDARGKDPVWISRLCCEHVLGLAEAAERLAGPAPLHGLTFAIKDNIDLADVPTTAACPDFEYTPTASAPVVQRLIDAGAIPLGKLTSTSSPPDSSVYVHPMACR